MKATARKRSDTIESRQPRCRPRFANVAGGCEGNESDRYQPAPIGLGTRAMPVGLSAVPHRPCKVGPIAVSLFDTHKVVNQPPPFEDINLFTSDAGLQDAVSREGGEGATKALSAFGAVCGSAAVQRRGVAANSSPPELETYDAAGHRIDRITHHASFLENLEMSMAEGVQSALWAHLTARGKERGSGVAVSRTAALYLAGQVDAGHCLPLSTTTAAVPALSLAGESCALTALLLPRIVAKTYDASLAPIADKRSILVGLGIAEKQAGSDIDGCTSVARKASSASDLYDYRLTGHKWWVSAPIADGFIIFAREDSAGDHGAVSCFFVPALLPDGSRNAIRFMRLKRAIGCRSAAAAEVEFSDAHAIRLGGPGQGRRAISLMMPYLQLDSMTLAAAMMRRTVAQAIHHAEYRRIDQKALIDQPLMKQVLADMALDVEAATALTFRIARAVDHARDAHAAAWVRFMAPVGRYWMAKIAPALAAEAMECIGGNSLADEHIASRIYRDVMANAIWPMPGNAQVLDVLTIMLREPEAVELVMDELGQASKGDEHLEAAHDRLLTILHDPRYLDVRARSFVEGLAILAAGTILRAHAPSSVADAFIATRAGSLARITYGQGLDWADQSAIISRASPNR